VPRITGNEMQRRPSPRRGLFADKAPVTHIKSREVQAWQTACVPRPDEVSQIGLELAFPDEDAQQGRYAEDVAVVAADQDVTVIIFKSFQFDDVVAVITKPSEGNALLIHLDGDNGRRTDFESVCEPDLGSGTIEDASTQLVG
jgi:hypothetical protein